MATNNKQGILGMWLACKFIGKLGFAKSFYDFGSDDYYLLIKNAFTTFVRIKLSNRNIQNAVYCSRCVA